MMVALVYSLPGLDWTHERDHVELFAGCMSVTAGELQDRVFPSTVCETDRCLWLLCSVHGCLFTRQRQLVGKPPLLFDKFILH